MVGWGGVRGVIASHPVSHGLGGGRGVSVIVLKELDRDCWSHSPYHGVQDGGCCGGARGRGRGAREA
jgi:hypothetical protein